MKFVRKFQAELPVYYEKAITDYLRKIGELIKEMVASGINFLENVLIVITVPAEYLEKDKAIMRKCAYNAELIKERYSKNLQFTTEPEAAAVYCMENNLKVTDLNTPETTFMIVDCGGGTVDLTTRKLLKDKQLGEVTERAGDFCGNNSDFTNYEMDIEDVVPVVMQYVTEEVQEKMEENDWVIEFGYDDIKSMFDSVVGRIIKMIHMQLDNNRETCSAMLLVGGLSQSKYLQERIKQEFQHRVKNISVPLQPIAAISRGAALYGLSMINSAPNFENSHKFVINERVLKYTYGISHVWKKGDPIERRRSNGRIHKFLSLAQRGTVVEINQEFTSMIFPISSTQSAVDFLIYFTAKYSAQYIDEDGMEKLESLLISLPDVHYGRRPILFGLTFGRMEITASAKNQLNGQNYQTTLKFDI
ncbi:hypothetical protein GLOIN_2v1487277 [Rhizophagus irregularis DAOM 181602=DAOM 197198]|uniref:Actin-like ATPase domain-containing protein n=4 Tax=Rhizophagus irregularis TaxID=588596 RepID=A0A2P4P423_RHIID|nr:hypothetical protein GLOIN_2v1487277 [Rhizophagus irregularis DAOM 181602=DAOM 197198]POG60125.1 hypothetical protein GLOIN_2v1487277 [Rhizophagus irregularis DAOM 181602=DAOM 197198]|eukprot:XP_025166991.1 hypothetical protein GLOIN_2v1487277 [Rhizophagus irregularis DAOM 181602=DAOM 197198]